MNKKPVYLSNVTQQFSTHTQLPENCRETRYTHKTKEKLPEICLQLNSAYTFQVIKKGAGNVLWCNKERKENLQPIKKVMPDLSYSIVSLHHTNVPLTLWYIVLMKWTSMLKLDLTGVRLYTWRGPCQHDSACYNSTFFWQTLSTWTPVQCTKWSIVTVDDEKKLTFTNMVDFVLLKYQHLGKIKWSWFFHKSNNG